MSDNWVEFEDRAEAEGFAQVSNALLRHPAISLAAKGFYSLLKSYAWQDPTTFPGIKRLRRDTGASDNTLKKYRDELMEIGLLDVKRRGRGQTNLYIFKSVGKFLEREAAKAESHTGAILESQMGSDQESHTGAINEDTEYEYAGNKGTERETSSLSGENEGKASASPAKKGQGNLIQLESRRKSGKPMPMKQYAVARLMELYNEAKARNENPIPLPDAKRSEIASFYEQYAKEGYEIQTLDSALERMVAKASGAIAGEPRAWTAFGTAVSVIEYGTAATGATTSQGTPEGGIAALEAHETLHRYAYLAHQHDFSQRTPPERNILRLLGGEYQEQHMNAERMGSVVRRALREASERTQSREEAVV